MIPPPDEAVLLDTVPCTNASDAPSSTRMPPPTESPASPFVTSTPVILAPPDAICITRCASLPSSVMSAVPSPSMSPSIVTSPDLSSTTSVDVVAIVPLPSVRMLASKVISSSPALNFARSSASRSERTPSSAFTTSSSVVTR